jgi:hypothetical protein
MPQLNMIEQLLDEKKNLEQRRDTILDQVDMERTEMKDEYPNPVIEDLLSELQTLVDNIFQIENTIRMFKDTCKKGLKKLGSEINIGDCVVLFNKAIKKHYFITGDTSYVNPSLGIISSSSPIAQQILARKFGEKLALMINGAKSEYKLLPM